MFIPSLGRIYLNAPLIPDGRAFGRVKGPPRSKVRGTNKGDAMNNTNFLAQYDAHYWRMRRKAEKAGILRGQAYKGPYKANLSFYGKRPAPGSEAERVRLAGRD